MKAKTNAKPAMKRLAVIGMGIQSRTMLLPQFLREEGVAVVAICDCDKTRREAGAKQANDFYKANRKELAGVCKPESDFRKIIKDKTIDMVAIVTPDLFTGRIDEYFNYCYGKLDYRTVRFEEEILPTSNYQGNAVVNYLHMSW